MMDAHSTASSAPGIERLIGHGVVYHNGVRLFEADYDLTITPPELRGLTFEPGNEPQGTPDITGRLLGPLYETEPIAHGATLVLADGRALDFRVIQPDTNEIVGVGVFTDAKVTPGLTKQED